MNFTIENSLLISAVLLLISILAGKTSFKLGIPTLLLFLLIGMLAGSESIGGIYFDDARVAQFIGIVSLCFILFSGGLDTDWKAIRPVLWQGISLSTIGVLFTAVLVGLFVTQITDFTIYEGLLLGAVVSSTDAAAVFSILRSKNLALKGNLRPVLEMESGSNDPMAYVLTLAFLGMVTNPSTDIFSIIIMLLRQMTFGGISGLLFGRLGKWIINSIKLDFEGLYPVLVIAIMFLTFSTTDLIGGNGFLAVYLCAVYLGNQDLIHKNTIMKMFDGLAWLMQIILFLTLGLLVFPSQIIPIMGVGIVISLFLMLVARPLGVFAALVFFRVHIRKRLYISWVGLRGAVPIVFATYPMLAGIEKSHMIFNIVFFITLTSVLIQGSSLSLVAHWLRVALPEKVKPRSPLNLFLSETAKTIIDETVLAPDGYAVGKKIVDLKFPHAAIIAMIKREGKFIIPNGSTQLQAGDKLIILSDTVENIGKAHRCLGLTDDEVHIPDFSS
ncbi:potassium/proton antiporter [Rhodoflexus caldus]|uniref:potassium/proton antiporter n=1 Tax=Rhodoflexus caldus TaxID=2891236 RepID=UPI002029E7FC|nr:potassium/proton antiporter [Rhodoflexus caldus]